MPEAESSFSTIANPILVTENYIFSGRECVDSDGKIGWLAESFSVDGARRSLWTMDGTLYGAGIVDRGSSGHPVVEIYGEALRVEPLRQMEMLRAVAAWCSGVN
ncbi:MAG: hypothetical protein WCC26_16720 [Terracidiphilus sp.]